MDATYPKCYVRTEFPVTIDWDISGIKGKLQALAKAGLVVESEGKIERPGFGNTKHVATAPSFELTDEGKKFYKADVGKTLSGKAIGGFCVGKATVMEVTQFSEPSDMFGQRISRVNYTYKVNDLPSWAKSDMVLEAINDLKIDAESEQKPIKQLDALILTNNGWVHEKLFKQ